MPSGVATEKLPRRRCKNCPAIFTPNQKHQQFCGPQCRKQYNVFGGAFVRVREAAEKFIKQRIRELSPADETRIAALEKRIEQLEQWRENMKEVNR